MNQLPLFDEISAREIAWREFHATNPQVFRMFERFALEAVRASAARAPGSAIRIGARMVWERMRWETTITPIENGVPWRLNDHHVPFFARLFLERHPELGPIFEIRERNLEHVR